MVFRNLLSIRHFLIVFLHIFKIYNYTTRLAYQDSEKTYWLRVIKKCLINTLRKNRFVGYPMSPSLSTKYQDLFSSTLSVHA